MAENNARPLTADEISQLTAQGCTAADWSALTVDPFFQPSSIFRTHFEGRVHLGAAVTLTDVGTIAGTGTSSFAIGEAVSVLKEDGGLEVVMHDTLSSMEAAFEVQEAQREPALVAAMQAAARAKGEARRGQPTTIASGARVSHVRLLRNVQIGTAAVVEGAWRLVEVTLASLPEAPCYVGDGVVMEHTVALAGSTVTDGAQVDHCFVGQGCHLGRLFSATASLFFANCHFENGEACALFAGPYSVSHHKGTLLIATQLSFFNAGSGSNQSNHAYKMGPNKYGQLLRGAKMGSNAYLYWPMQIGAFTTVIGHHAGHQDLRPFPFSLLAENEAGEALLLPGQALRSVGTRRDVQKWPQRDHRASTPAARLDHIDFSLLNPFTMGYVQQGLALLHTMKEKEKTNYQGLHFSPHQLSRGVRLYEEAVSLYLYECLTRWGVTLEHPTLPPASLPALAARNASLGAGEWVDYGGLLIPREALLTAMREGLSWEAIEADLPAWERLYVEAHFDLSDPARLLTEGAAVRLTWDNAFEADAARDLASCQITL